MSIDRFSFFAGALLSGMALFSGASVAKQTPSGTASAAVQGVETTVAAAKKPVEIALSLKKVITGANGKPELVDAPKVKPGDLLEYQAVYSNRSKTAVTGLVAALPVPEGLEYQGASARPAGVLATVDGKTYAAEPLMRKVKGPNGKEKMVKVPYEEYRGLRWTVGALAPGKSTTVSARMRVSSSSSPAGVVTPASVSASSAEAKK